MIDCNLSFAVISCCLESALTFWLKHWYSTCRHRFADYSQCPFQVFLSLVTLADGHVSLCWGVKAWIFPGYLSSFVFLADITTLTYYLWERGRVVGPRFFMALKSVFSPWCYRLAKCAAFSVSTRWNLQVCLGKLSFLNSGEAGWEIKKIHLSTILFIFIK